MFALGGAEGRGGIGARYLHYISHSDTLALREMRSGTKLEGELRFALTSLSADIFQGSVVGTLVHFKLVLDKGEIISFHGLGLMLIKYRMVILREMW